MNSTVWGTPKVMKSGTFGTAYWIGLNRVPTPMQMPTMRSERVGSSRQRRSNLGPT